jgi:hypothetical protein
MGDRMAYPRGSAARVLVFVGLAVLFSAGIGAGALSARAQAWQGKEETRDGVRYVVNPPDPSSAAVVVTPRELWRTGEGDEEEGVLLGVVSQITSDDGGTLYVLDAQLNQVVVFSPEGKYIRSIGREGDGPGEFRRPTDLFLTSDGNVAVIQRMPGRIVLLTPEGEPVGDMRVPRPENDGTLMFGGGRLAAKNVVLNVNTFARRDAGFSTTTSLVAIDPDGNLVATYFDKRDENDFANLVFDEKKSGLGLVWNVDRDGRVFMSDDFDAYRFQVWNPSGSLARVVEREYTHRKRSVAEMKRFAPTIGLRQGDQTRRPEVRPSDTDRDIQQIFPRDNGDVWVLSSKGAFDVPKRVIGTFDVFGPDGRLVRQITLNGTGSWARDEFYILGDRFYVATGLRSARRAMFGAGEGAESEEDEEPMGLVCYGFGPASTK